jgi:hypothetical protein
MTDDPFNSFGQFVPYSRRQRAHDTVKQMIPELGTAESMALIDSVSESIRRDMPYEAMERARKNLDVTGCYRLLAVLCTD